MLHDFLADLMLDASLNLFTLIRITYRELGSKSFVPQIVVGSGAPCIGNRIAFGPIERCR